MASLESPVTNLDYTYSFSKYSCLRSFYFIHVTCCYFVFLSGIACFVSRLHSKIKFLHEWFGRIYIISMLFATASSLLINNTGLPGPTLISFSYSMGGLSVGWLIIKIYQIQINNAVTKMVEQSIQKMQIIDKTFNLKQLYTMTTMQYLNTRTWKQRFISFKTIHGILMLLSWFGIAGRIFASDQSGDFTCYTYPVYKPVNTDRGGSNSSKGMDLEDQPLQLVPEDDPEYDRLPWANQETAWAVRGFFTPLIIGAVVGLIWTYVESRRAKKNGYTVAKTKSIDIKTDGDSTTHTPDSNNILDAENHANDSYSSTDNAGHVDMESQQTNGNGNQ